MFVLATILLSIGICSKADDNLPADYCKDMPPGGYKRHPNDCSRYVSCWSASNFHVLSCQANLLYDESRKACNYPALVNCGNSPRPRHETPTVFAPAVPTHPPTHRHPNPARLMTRKRTEFTGRPQTRAKVSKPVRNKRPEAEMVHAVHQEDMSKFVKVVSPRVNEVNAKDDPSPTCSRNGLYPNSHDCRRYFICTGGRPYSFSCAPGTYFDQELLRCEFHSGFSHKEPCRKLRGPQRKRPTATNHAPGRVKTEKPRLTKVKGQSEDKLKMVAGFLEKGKKMAKAKVIKAAKMESKKAGRGGAGQKAFHGVANFLGSNKVIKKMSLAAEQQLETLKIIKDKFHLDKEEVKMVMKKMHSTLVENPSNVSPDTPKENIKMDLDTCPFPDEEKRSRCDPSSRYRTMDGSCNNLKHPLWGRAMTPLTRFLDPDYCDNIGCPRRGKKNETLPSGRLVSKSLFDAKPDTSHVHTFILMSTGQLLDHDLTKTALTMISTDAQGSRSRDGGTLSEVTCGSDGCSTEGEENRACMPIEIPAGDTAFGSLQCLMFVRTQEVPQLDCQLGPRQQLNQLSHYIDASMTYGSSKEEMEKLRHPDSTRGSLRSTPNRDPKLKPLLPQGENKDCRDTNSTIRCFISGDERVNENVPLTGLHVVLMRTHNHIERELHRINPQWGGERLLQETRKIIGAIWQHIIYNEYLPIILGPRSMSRYGLTLRRAGFNSAYDPSVSAEVANVFATAAFRFSHSMISDMVAFGDENYKTVDEKPLSTMLRRPFEIYNNERQRGSAVDGVLHGMIAKRAMRVDRHFTKEVTEHLFAENPPHGPGTDLGAINIQRGRDHGIPGYNAWRRWCNLPVARSFDDLSDLDPEAIVILKGLYSHVDDIDIFPGAISERNVAGGMVGPTFACILGRQFRNLKVGDRFWYENRSPVVGFTLDQLTEIRKVTLSKLICMACDVISTIQKYVMLRPISEAFKDIGGQRYAEVYSLASLYHGEQNERKPCSSLPNLDFSKWKE